MGVTSLHIILLIYSASCKSFQSPMCFCCSIEITILFEFETPEHFSMPKYLILWDWSCFIQTRHWLLWAFSFLMHLWKFKGHILQSPSFFKQSSNTPSGQILSFLQFPSWSKTPNSNWSSRIIFNLYFILLLLQWNAAQRKRLSLSTFARTAMTIHPPYHCIDCINFLSKNITQAVVRRTSLSSFVPSLSRQRSSRNWYQLKKVFSQLLKIRNTTKHLFCFWAGGWRGWLRGWRWVEGGSIQTPAPTVLVPLVLALVISRDLHEHY